MSRIIRSRRTGAKGCWRLVPGSGMALYVRIRAAGLSEPQVFPSLLSGRGSGRPSGAGMFRILLVDDDPVAAYLMRKVMENLQGPHELHSVIDGVEALDFLHRRETRAIIGI